MRRHELSRGSKDEAATVIGTLPTHICVEVLERLYYEYFY
jgi:hypothetical protein